RRFGVRAAAYTVLAVGVGERRPPRRKKGTMMGSPTIQPTALYHVQGHVQDEALSPALLPWKEGIAYPLSLAQQRLWILDQLVTKRSVHHTSLAVRLLGQLDSEAIALGFEALVARHEALRTSIMLVEGQPAAVVVPQAPTPLARRDLRTLPQA